MTEDKADIIEIRKVIEGIQNKIMKVSEVMASFLDAETLVEKDIVELKNLVADNHTDMMQNHKEIHDLKEQADINSDRLNVHYNAREVLTEVLRELINDILFPYGSNAKKELLAKLDSGEKSDISAKDTSTSTDIQYQDNSTDSIPSIHMACDNPECRICKPTPEPYNDDMEITKTVLGWHGYTAVETEDLKWLFINGDFSECNAFKHFYELREKYLSEEK